jgi:hypothetical protein
LINEFRIVAAVLDTVKLTLYGEDGVTITLTQGDARIRRIVDEVIPQIRDNGFAVVNLATEVGNPYADFEEKSGKVRFFRVAKDKLKNLFGFGSKKEEIPVVEVTLQSTAGEILVADLLSKKSNENVADAVIAPISKNVIDEIMQHATPATDPMFSEEGLDKQASITDETGHTPSHPTVTDSTDTIIAVIDNKIVPGMERIKSQFDRAAKLGSVIGVEKFLERLSKVISQRRHSVDDLLQFLERGDLPIADDGCILIYKMLKRCNFNQYPNAAYADCHTNKVPQWVGARVFMNPKLVDPNRQQDCSNGLHVARRGYMGNFSGDVCVMAKLAPEDVIAVPEYDANKMRVCGYNIIFELSSEHYALLKSNKPLTLVDSGKMLLARALKGDHPKMTDTVEITKGQGGGIKVTHLIPPSKPVAPIVLMEPKQELVPAEALPDNNAEAFDSPVDPRQVVKEVEKGTENRKEKVHALMAAFLQSMQGTNEPKQLALVEQLVQIKKAAKVSWERLGVSPETVALMDSLLVVVTPTTKIPPTVATPPPQVVSNEQENQSLSQRILKLASITLMDVNTAQSILEIKKKAKKSWTALKVPDEIVNRVLALTTSK